MADLGCSSSGAPLCSRLQEQLAGGVCCAVLCCVVQRVTPQQQRVCSDARTVLRPWGCARKCSQRGISCSGCGVRHASCITSCLGLRAGDMCAALLQPRLLQDDGCCQLQSQHLCCSAVTTPVAVRVHAARCCLLECGRSASPPTTGAHAQGWLRLGRL